MFASIEALNFRCLRYVRQPLGAFHALVGPNGSGKTTFLEVISFLRDLVSDGLDSAIEKRTANLRDLFWAGHGDRFELAVEAVIPEERRRLLPQDKPFGRFRYEVAIGIDAATNENSILHEYGTLRPDGPTTGHRQPHLFPQLTDIPETLRPVKATGSKFVFSKSPGQLDNFYPETAGDAGSGKWVPSFRLGPRRSTLGNLLEDESRFPVATWFKGLLSRGVQSLMLNSLLIRRASPPGQGRSLKADGSNLPWAINALEMNGGERLSQWVAHLQTALPDVSRIRTIDRSEDKYRYLEIEYAPGIRVPSWMVSDGTLRLLALTLPAYLPGFTGVFLIEEPENGIHPRAIETMIQSLSSVYDAQILLATHSPIVLSMVGAEQVLCFAKTPEGATDIVRGDEHPRLAKWKGEEDLGVLFAGGILG